MPDIWQIVHVASCLPLAEFVYGDDAMRLWFGNELIHRSDTASTSTPPTNDECVRSSRGTTVGRPVDSQEFQNRRPRQLKRSGGGGKEELRGMALNLAVSTASGFVPPVALPARTQGSRTALIMGVESELGATGPLGYWDPLGLVR